VVKKMDERGYRRELLAYDEKIALCELEESMAVNATKKLRYSRAQFCLQVAIAVAAPQPPPPTKEAGPK
jgi:hypothetical protein